MGNNESNDEDDRYWMSEVVQDHNSGANDGGDPTRCLSSPSIHNNKDTTATSGHVVELCGVQSFVSHERLSVET